MENTIPAGIKGLSESEAAQLRNEGKGNNITQKTSRSYGEIIRENLFTSFNLVLFALGIILIALGSPGDAVITSGVVLINVLVAVFQEIKAKRKLDQIALLTRPKARVMRDGEEKEMDPSDIVLGDTLVLNPGDQIMVDGEILEGRMDADESLLTGESDLIQKKVGDTVLSGSFCVGGSAYYQASKVGMDCYVNKLSAGAKVFVRELTPLQREIDLLVRVLLAVVVFFSILLGLNFIFNQADILDSVRAASVMFGLAPNSLLLMIVIAYAMGALRISTRGALVQQANSVESLCHVTVLCLDKTGTITANRIKFNEIIPIDQSKSRDEMINMLGIFSRSLSVSNKTAEAISDACPGEKTNIKQEVPFSSSYKWSGAVFDSEKLKGTFILGAPEIIMSDYAQNQTLADQIAENTDKGLRMLLLMWNPAPCNLLDKDEKPQLPESLTPLCFISFSDELRPDAKETLEKFLKDGIKVKIISGDNPKTVAALARQVGLAEPDGSPLKIISGTELKKMDEASFAQAAVSTTIFGRVTPDQKEALVTALRSQGQYVAMTGDGVNDMLALKKANLGISMQSGSPATRSVAHIVLLNDSFSVLPEAFREGQRILSGMQDILKLYLNRLFYLLMLISAVAILGMGFPFTPKQGSIVSILTLSLPSFAIAIWAKPAKIRKGSILLKLLHFLIPATIISCIACLTVYITFDALRKTELYAQHGLTYMMILLGFIMIIFTEPPIKFFAGGDSVSNDWKPTLLVCGMFSAFIALMFSEKFRHFFELKVLDWGDYGIIACIFILWMFILRYVWRSKLVEKYLNVKLDGPEDGSWL